MTSININYSSFITAIGQFKNYNAVLRAGLVIQQPLDSLEETFSQEVRLQHPRQVYPLYKALNQITDEVAKKSLSALTSAWNNVLTQLKDRRIYVVGMGLTSFDTSIAEEILVYKLEGLKQRITVAPIDVTEVQNRQEVVNYIYKTNQEAFMTCFRKGFIAELLKSDRVRCIVARKEAEIVGILWGFFARYQNQNQNLFHFWEFSRRAPMAEMGIARGLMDCAHQQQTIYPDLKFATLNVDRENENAKEIYDHENFTDLGEQESEKIFMTNNLTSEESEEEVGLEPEAAKKIIRTFVINSVPFYKLIFFELMRRCELIWRACWYR